MPIQRGKLIGGGVAVDYFDRNGKWLARVYTHDQKVWRTRVTDIGELPPSENEKAAEAKWMSTVLGMMEGTWRD